MAAGILQIYAKTSQWRAQVIARFGALPSARLSGSKTYDPPIVAPGAAESTTVTVAGALLGQQAAAAFSLDLAGLYLTASVAAADTVTATFVNPTIAPIDLDEGTLTAFAWVD